MVGWMDGLIDWLINWLIDWMIDWSITMLWAPGCQRSDCYAFDRRISWLTDWLIDWSIDRSIDRWISWLFNWFTEWLPHWLAVSLTDNASVWMSDNLIAYTPRSNSIEGPLTNCKVNWLASKHFPSIQKSILIIIYIYFCTYGSFIDLWTNYLLSNLVDSLTYSQIYTVLTFKSPGSWTWKYHVNSGDHSWDSAGHSNPGSSDWYRCN